MTILERLRAATGPLKVNDANDLAFYAGFHSENYSLMVSALRGGVGAVGSALALVDRMLPGWSYLVRPEYCELLHPKRKAKDVNGRGATPALAILIALFTAIDAKERT